MGLKLSTDFDVFICLIKFLPCETNMYLHVYHREKTTHRNTANAEKYKFVIVIKLQKCRND